MDFKVGDTVRLKSGRPVMTVEVPVVSGTGKVRCQWFDDKKVLQSAVFFPDALELDDDKLHVR